MSIDRLCMMKYVNNDNSIKFFNEFLKTYFKFRVIFNYSFNL